MKYTVTLAGRRHEVEVDGQTVRVDGHLHEAHLCAIAGTPLRHLLLDGRAALLAMDGAASSGGVGCWAILARGEQVEVEVVDARTEHIRSMVGGAKAHTGGGVLKAPMPGLVVRVLVEEGQIVDSGTGILVLEAMKMENELKAAGRSRVLRVVVRPGQAVEKGGVLVEFEAAVESP